MLKGGALLMVIAISLLLTMLLSSLILYSFYTKIEEDFSLKKIQMVNNANSAIQLLLSNYESFPFDQSSDIDLYGNKNDSVEITKKLFGLFEIGIARAHFRNLEYKKVAMVASDFSPLILKAALYLSDISKPLSVCGVTKLIGDCYLPTSGVKRAYIEGQSFVGSEMVNGKILKSENTLPKLNDSAMSRIANYLSQNFSPGENDSLLSWSDVEQQDSVFNSFSNRTVIITSSFPVTLQNKFLGGNIILISKDSIAVKRDAVLNDIILCAPKIKFEQDFTGSLQAFASDLIIIGRECHFIYPSACGVMSSDPNRRMLIEIDSSSLIEGVVFCYQSMVTLNSTSTISLATKAAIYGQIYSSGSVDLKGSVYGNVICNKFILRTSSSVYENHLLNAEIDANKLSQGFSFPLLLKDSKANKIVQWLK